MRPTLHPITSPRSPASAGVWRWYFERHLVRVGEAHPAAQAAAGRWFSYTSKRIPQVNAATPAAIAWYRGTGARPGYMNRHARKHLARKSR